MERAVCYLSTGGVDAVEEANGKRCARVHFSSTSTLSDTIVQATPRPMKGRLENLFFTTVAEKTRVLGVANLLRGEESAAAEAAVPLLHQEKSCSCGATS